MRRAPAPAETAHLADEVLSSRWMADDDANDSAEFALVDTGLIDAMLALGPEERLRQNDRMVRTVLLLRQGFESMKAGHDGREP